MTNRRSAKTKYLVQAKLRTSDKQFYSKKEDRLIIKMRNQEGNSTKMIAEELSNKFGIDRTPASVHHRVLNILRFLKTLDEYDYVENSFLISRRELESRKERVFS